MDDLLETVMPRMVNQADADALLSRLIEDSAAADQEYDAPHAKLESASVRRVPADALKVSFIAHDFDAPDPEIEELFHGGPEKMRP